MKIGEVITLILGVMFLGLVIVGAFLREKDANKTCVEMIALAQTRSDTLVVYGMKPGRVETCADRLR